MPLQSSWKIAEGWYDEQSITRAVEEGWRPTADERDHVPKTNDPVKFGKWLTHQYRLAMNKGIELARQEMRRELLIYEPTPAFEADLERLKGLTGLTAAELTEKAFTLLRIHVKAAQEDKQIILESDKYRDEIALPFTVRKEPRSTER